MTDSMLSALLQRFFTDRLTRQLQASPKPVAGYRDTFRLLLQYTSQRRNRPPSRLRLDDLNSALIAATSSPMLRGYAATAPAAETPG